MFVQNLGSNNAVVQTYAAACIDRLLIVRDNNVQRWTFTFSSPYLLKKTMNSLERLDMERQTLNLCWQTYWVHCSKHWNLNNQERTTTSWKVSIHCIMDKSLIWNCSYHQSDECSTRRDLTIQCQVHSGFSYYSWKDLQKSNQSYIQSLSIRDHCFSNQIHQVLLISPPVSINWLIAPTVLRTRMQLLPLRSFLFLHSKSYCKQTFRNSLVMSSKSLHCFWK